MSVGEIVSSQQKIEQKIESQFFAAFSPQCAVHAYIKSIRAQLGQQDGWLKIDPFFRFRFRLDKNYGKSEIFRICLLVGLKLCHSVENCPIARGHAILVTHMNA
jgi:hypothetical protein